MIETGRHTHPIALAALLIVFQTATGCDRGNDRVDRAGDTAVTIAPSHDPDTAGTPAGRTDDPGGEPRPATKNGTIALEGMPEAVQLRLIGEGLPFSTYVPERDFVLEQASSEEGTGIRFIASFGGVKNPDAALSFFLPGERFTQLQMEELIAGSEGVAESNGWTTEKLAEATFYCPWAVSAYRISGEKEIIGHACIGLHNDQAFYVIAVYPREYADGFGPRASLILSEFRWKDTGTGLDQD